MYSEGLLSGMIALVYCVITEYPLYTFLPGFCSKRGGELPLRNLRLSVSNIANTWKPLSFLIIWF